VRDLLLAEDGRGAKRAASLRENSDGGGAIVRGDRIALQASNGSYACAESGGGGEGSANRSSIDP